MGSDISYRRSKAEPYIPIEHCGQLFDGLHRQVNGNRRNAITSNYNGLPMLTIKESMNVSYFLSVIGGHSIAMAAENVEQYRDMITNNRVGLF